MFLFLKVMESAEQMQNNKRELGVSAFTAPSKACAGFVEDRFTTCSDTH